MAVSEGATIQHSLYRHRRIYLPRTLVYKEKKDVRGLRRPLHLINIDPGAERQGGTRCTPKALHILEVQLPDRDNTRQKEERWRPSRKPTGRRKLSESLIPTWRA